MPVWPLVTKDVGVLVTLTERLTGDDEEAGECVEAGLVELEEELCCVRKGCETGKISLLHECAHIPSPPLTASTASIYPASSLSLSVSPFSHSTSVSHHTLRESKYAVCQEHVLSLLQSAHASPPLEARC